MITFLTSLLWKLTNSFNCFFSFCTPAKVIAYVNDKILVIYRKFFLAQKNALNDKATNVENLLVTLCTLYFLNETVIRCPVIGFVLSEEYITQLSQSNENASLTSILKYYISVLLIHSQYLACQAMLSQSALNLYQHVLLKRAKIYHLYHCFHLLLTRTSESTTAPLSGHY